MINAHPHQNRLPQHHVKKQHLHLGSGPDYREEWINVDINPDANPDVVADLSEPWDFAETNSAEVIEARHVIEHLEDREAFFREAGRVLRPCGRLDIAVPLGVNWDTDSDHKGQPWTFRTPEQFSQSHRRQWDPDVPFEMEKRNVDVWLAGPLSKASPLLRLAAVKWPEWAARRCFAGELEVTYRRVSED